MKDNCVKLNQPERIELVHKQTTPVPGPSLYEDAILRGEFIGTFEEYQDSFKGTKGDDGDSPYVGPNGNWWVNGVDQGVICNL